MPIAQRWDPSSLRLIAITDSLRDGIDGLAARAFAAVHGGATMIHLRLPEESPRTQCSAARMIRAAVPQVPLVVNGRFDVALAAGAAGVHLGVDDLSPESVRRAVPPEFIIGVSVGSVAEVARAAHADFVGIGPLFSHGGVDGEMAPLGPDGFAALATLCERPAVAIGGIDATNAASVMRAGASGIAVISALFGSTDPQAAARSLRVAVDASGS
jgi:thiamine-phosphate pyrophosphorylase